tara:strand:+ start:222 stop:434 length:213 start_codon:yes stop_codon:yes gene_type:complete
MNKLEYILISYSTPKRASLRMGKNSLNIKRIIANSESDAIFKRDKYLKNIDADLFNYRWTLNKINNKEVA